MLHLLLFLTLFNIIHSMEIIPKRGWCFFVFAFALVFVGVLVFAPCPKK